MFGTLQYATAPVSFCGNSDDGSYFNHGSVTTNDNRTIQADPEMFVSFSWSDFPIIAVSMDESERYTVALAKSFPLRCDNCYAIHAARNEESSSCLLACATPHHAAATTKKKSHKKNVSFSKLSIREYSVVFGDHPCASSLPLSLGWDSSELPEVSIDIYEATRPRRRGKDMRLSHYERKNLLKRIGGLTEPEIQRAERQHLVRNIQQDSHDDICCSSFSLRRNPSLAILNTADLS